MSNAISREQSLISAVEGIAAGAAPVVVFENGTPAGWNAVIVAMGAAFFYKDANEKPIGDEQQQRPGPLHSGQSSFVQGTRSDCCGRVVVAMTVTMDGKSQTLTGQVPDTSKECFLRTTFRLAPKSSVLNDGSNGNPFQIELRRID